MKMRKIVGLILSTAVLAGVFVGCGSTKENTSEETKETTTTEGEENTDKAVVLTEIPLPIVKESMEITYWRPNDAKLTASVEGFKDNKAYQEKEKLTGIKVNFEHPPVGQQGEQFNLLIASTNLPDVIYYNWAAAPGGAAKALADGQILRLNEYIDQYAPNLKKLIETDEDIRKQISLDDGTIYMFPYIRQEAEQLNATWGFQLRQDWLDKLGLENPTTIDEWYNVLTAFRDEDPNGNGIKDEIPFTGNSGGNIMGVLNSFSPAFGVLGGFYLDGDKIEYGITTPEYKEFVKTMAKWYSEGLIDPELVTNDAKSFDYKMTNELAGSFNGAIFSGMGRFTTTVQATNPDFKLVGAPWPIGSAGKPYVNGRLDTKVLTFGEAITSSCDESKIPAIVQWMDFNYSEQGSMLFNFGIEGESYEMIDGYPTYTDTIWNNPEGLSNDQALATYALSIMDGPMNQDVRYLEQMCILDEQKEANKTWMGGSQDLGLPAITLTESESKRNASIMGQVNTYVNETLTKYVMGQESIDDNWDTFVKNLNSMGLEEATKMHNDALARFNSR